jgi:Flp pilus assembly protein TadG
LRSLFIQSADVFRREERGAAAVEAAIILPVFLLCVFMIIQMGLMLSVQTMLDNGTRDAARLIALGQVQTGGGRAAFANQLCNDVGSGLVSCTDLQFSVVSGAGFASLSLPPALDQNGNLPNAQFSPGGPGDDVLVEVTYNFPVMVPFLATTSGWPLISLVAFRNELYQ